MIKEASYNFRWAMLVKISSLTNKCWVKAVIFWFTQSRERISWSISPWTCWLYIVFSNATHPTEYEYSFSRLEAPCLTPLNLALVYLTAKCYFNPLGNRCGPNFEIIIQIIIKQFSEVLRNYKIQVYWYTQQR